MRHRLLLFSTMLAAAIAASCDSGNGNILSLKATATVTGNAFIDLDGNGQQTGADAAATDLDIWLSVRGGRDTTAITTTDRNGDFTLSAVPVGSYDVHVDSASLGDSVRVSSISPSRLTLAADSTVRVQVTATFPTITVAAARMAAVGRRVFVRGVALNGWGNYGDSTVHVQDASGTLRATRIRPASVAAGDTVRILGAVGRRDGQPTLTDATAFVEGPGVLPDPRLITTTTAADASAGALDATLVALSRASVLDAHTNVANDIVLTVDDGSGTATMLLDRNAGFTSGSAPVPGSVVDAVGLLVPDPDIAGRWQIKPRSQADITVNFPTVTVAQARQQPAGKRVSVEGVALNGWATFADSTVHLRDATGAIRVVRVRPANVFAGDSIRILGTAGSRDGQPLLSDGVATILAAATHAPAVQRLATSQAAIAVGGLLDADLVQVVGAIVADTATVAGDFRLNVSDGSGTLTVLIDRDLGLRLDVYRPGGKLDITGVLVPLPGGVWELKPRSVADLVIR